MMDNQSVTGVAIYVRVSSEEQAEKGYSIEEQKNVLLSFCNKVGYNVYKVYCDAGISAKDIVHRPGLQELLEDAKSKCFNLVLTWKISRLSRRLKDAIEIVDFLDKYSIQYKSYTEPFETNTPSGKLQFQMMSMVAEFERSTIAQNVKMGHLAKAKKGEWCGGPAMLGYEWEVMEQYKDCTGRRKSKLIINPEEAKIVKLIFEMYADGKGYKAITNHLNKMGYKTKNGCAFSLNGVRDILLNPVYVGKVRYDVRRNWNERRRGNTNPDPIIADGIHEAIISQELWDKVQIMYNQKKGRRGTVFSYEFPLTGILRCPECGAGMVVGGTTNTLKDGTKKRIPYYVCGSFSNKGSAVCHANSVRAIDTNKEVYKRVKMVCTNSLFRDKVIKEARNMLNGTLNNYQRELEMCDSQIKSNNQKKEKLFEAFESDIISSEEFLERKKTLDEKIANINSKREALLEEKARAELGSVADEVIEETLNNFDQVLENSDKKELKKEMLHMLIKEISVTNGKPKEVDKIVLNINNDLIEYLNTKDGSNITDSSFAFFENHSIELII